MSEGHECPASADGVCAVHGIEIERRRSSDKQVDNLKGVVDENSHDIGVLFSRMSKRESFSAQARVVGIIAMAVWAGSFLYTYVSNQSAAEDLRVASAVHDIMHSDIEDLKKRIGKLEGFQLVNNEKFIRLLERIDVTNDRLSDIIDRMDKNKNKEG